MKKIFTIFFLSITLTLSAFAVEDENPETNLFLENVMDNLVQGQCPQINKFSDNTIFHAMETKYDEVVLGSLPFSNGFMAELNHRSKNLVKVGAILLPQPNTRSRFSEKQFVSVDFEVWSKANKKGERELKVVNFKFYNAVNASQKVFACSVR